jgi:hypothetical protein
VGRELYLTVGRRMRPNLAEEASLVCGHASAEQLVEPIVGTARYHCDPSKHRDAHTQRQTLQQRAYAIFSNLRHQRQLNSQIDGNFAFHTAIGNACFSSSSRLINCSNPTRLINCSNPTVTLPNRWRKVRVRAFAAIFYETNPDGGVSRLPQNMRLSTNLVRCVRRVGIGSRPDAMHQSSLS